jgi:hypothetical protein
MKSIRIAAVVAVLVLATAAFFLVRGKGDDETAASAPPRSPAAT